MQWITNKDKKEEKKNEMLTIRHRIQELEDERMSEQKFWNYVMDGQDEFEYGRDVLKEGTYENLLKLPYSEFPLFTNPWYGNRTA